MEHERLKQRASSRRKHRFRMRRRAAQVFPFWPEAWKWGDHICGCSCVHCGNPRRRLRGRARLTRQEKAAAQATREQLDELSLLRRR